MRGLGMRVCGWAAGAMLVLVTAAPLHGRADAGDSRFEEIKQDFLTQRNRDPAAGNIAAWQALASRFETFAARNAKHRRAPAALLHAAIIYGRLDAQHTQALYAQKAFAALDKLVDRYPQDVLADDALLQKGDLLSERGARGEAKKCYETLLSAYPRGDMYEVAKVRLRTLVHDGAAPDAAGTPSEPAARRSGRPLGKHGALIVVLDPGHGGEDFGAVGVGGLLEKDVTLAVALELERLLKRELKAEVHLTRRVDVFMPLSERTALANEVGAQIFVSLHTNASPKGKLSGMEVYYLDNTKDQASKTLAERENKSLTFEGADMNDLQFMLSDLIQNAKLDDSIRLAHAVQDGLMRHMDKRWGSLAVLGVRRAPFYVLVGAHMPCVLVEMFFIDHLEDGARLAEKRFREDLAYGLFEGIQDFAQGGR